MAKWISYRFFFVSISSRTYINNSVQSFFVPFHLSYIYMNYYRQKYEEIMNQSEFDNKYELCSSLPRARQHLSLISHSLQNDGQVIFLYVRAVSQRECCILLVRECARQKRKRIFIQHERIHPSITKYKQRTVFFFCVDVILQGSEISVEPR
jgi:hypothetical protein